MSTATTETFRIYIKAPIDKVWAHIVEPAYNGRYAYMAAAQYDLTPGGEYVCRSTPDMLQFGAPEVMCFGKIIESNPPKRFVQTWAANFTPETIAEGTRTLTWDLHEDDHGVTSVTVVHDLTAAPKTRLFVTGTGDPSEGGGGGWAWILSDLKSLIETSSSMFARP